MFNACANADANFVIAGRANVYKLYRKRIERWRKSKLRARNGTQLEIGSCLYRQAECRQTFRIVMIRWPDEVDPQSDIFEHDGYVYRAFFTNVGESELNNEKIVKFYRKRGHAENFIRESKNGFDLQHLPCQSLAANRIYALIASFAQSYMRFAGYLRNKNKPTFAKNIRFYMVNIAPVPLGYAKWWNLHAL